MNLEDNGDQIAEQPDFEPTSNDPLDFLPSLDPNLMGTARKKDATIFLIDSRASIFHREEDENESQFMAVMECVCDFYRRNIVKDEGDKIGLIFYNCLNANNTLQFHGINVFSECEIPWAKKVSEIMELPFVYFEELGFSKEPAKLSEALLVCQHELSKML